MKFNNRNIHLGENVSIGENVRLGDNVVIYDNVRLGDNSTICNDCVIGEPLNDYYYNKEYKNPETVIGANALIRSHTIIYADNVIGENLNTGHRVTIREKCQIGKNFAIGTISDIQGYIEIGDYCRLHGNIQIGQKSKLGNFVFIYPYVNFTNDQYPPSNDLKGPVVDDFAQIAVMCVILPGIHIGKHALVGPGSTVMRDVEDYKWVSGNPARALKDVRDLISQDSGKSHYPWPYNFSRGMPWEGQDFDTWFKNSIYSK